MQSATLAPHPHPLPPPRPWYAQVWPWLLIFPPLCATLAGSYAAWLAYSRQDAMVVDDYYKEGQAINQDLRRARMAALLKMDVSLRLDNAGGQLTGIVSSAAANQSDRLKLKFIHPTQPEKDRSLAIAPDAAGKFAVKFPALEKTQWQVAIQDESGRWRLDGVWAWPQQQAIRLRTNEATTSEADF